MRSGTHSCIGISDYLSSCYILVLEIPVGAVVYARVGRRSIRLEQGIYFYTGSAKGTCNVLCRVLRHLAPVKKVHWHIDSLTSNPAVVKHGFFMVMDKGGDCEEELSLILKSRLGFIKGFGCSDKPGDVSHLYLCREVLEECLQLVYEILDEAGFNPIWVQA